MARIPLVSEFKPQGIDKAIREFKKLETTGQKIGFGLKKAFLPATAAVAGLAAAAVPAISKASDLNENISKTEVIFGDAADAVKAFAETAATSIGQSQTAALDAAGTFGTFGKAAGLAGADLASFTTDFITLASDLASFNNTSPEEAVMAIGGALRGESEPLRRYGVLLNDATLKAEALSLGIYDGTGALNDQQKILAAQSAIMKQTSDAQGDFARTSEGLANSQRTLTAQFDDFQAKLGTALLPVVEAIMPMLIGMTDWAANNTDVILGIGAAVGVLAGSILVANGAMAAWNAITVITAALNAILGTSFTALWVATGVGIVIALIGVIVTLQLKFNILGKAVEGLKIAFDVLWQGVKWVLNKVIDGINLLIRAWNKLPLVPDIEEITYQFGEAAEASRDASDMMVKDRESAKKKVIEETLALDDLKLSLRDVGKAAQRVATVDTPSLTQGFDGLKGAISQVDLELRSLMGELEREEAVAKFQEKIDDLTESLGTDEFEGALRDAKLGVFELADDVGGLSAALQKELIFAIDTGDAEYLDLLIRSIAENWSAFSGVRFTSFDQAQFETLDPFREAIGGMSPELSAALSGRAANRGGNTNITVNMPAGSNGDDVVRALQRTVRKGGALPLAVNGARR